ncbi:MAG TPA: FMN-binding negative transcriptional regulator, partial [Ramlibacter sp.]|nr:FMN-binding negative transcriptional regulator [Ramlibacter sp.]
EPPFAQRWKGFDPDFARKMLAGIVGFELRVTDLQCKVKLNQHRPESWAAQKAGYEQGGDHERALAQWMERFGWTGR